MDDLGTRPCTSFIIVGSCTMIGIWLIDLLCVGSMIEPGLYNCGDVEHVPGNGYVKLMSRPKPS